jgi:hypothetical protein
MFRTRVRPVALLALFFFALSVFAALASCGLDVSGTVPDEAGADGSRLGDAVVPDVVSDAGRHDVTVDAPGDGPAVDPDPNEPNDTTPTVIPIVSDAGTQSGSHQGVIATPGDVDRFSFAVAAGTFVVYARVTAPALVPETNVRLRYALHGPGLAGPVLATGEATDGGVVDLGTARLVTGAQAGAYALVVSALPPPGGGVAPADPRLVYTVEVRILPVDDVHEPNDAASAAVVRNLASPGASSTTSVGGRVGWVGDADWFRVDLAAASEPTVLSYRLAPKGPGRFPRLPGPKGIRVRAMTAVTDGATVEARRTACKTNAATCPKGYEAAAAEWVSQVEALCDAPAGPMCLRSARIEHQPHVALSNFGGAIAVPPHAATVSFFFVVDDVDADGADDVPYALDVSWSSDPDEASRTSGGVEQETSFPLVLDPGTTYPTPAAEVPAITGRLTYGFGLGSSLDPASSDAVRGPDDYDATPSDEDVYRIQLPSLAAPEDRTWALSWTVDTEGSATRAHDLLIDVTFCDGDLLDNDGQCTKVSARGDGTPIRFTSPGLSVPWPTRPNGAPIAHFSQATASTGDLDAGTLVTSSTSTARAEACFCLEPRFVRGGTVVLRVRAADRRSYAPSTYSLRTSFLSYPQHASCPAPPMLPDGGIEPGCRFAR